MPNANRYRVRIGGIQIVVGEPVGTIVPTGVVVPGTLGFEPVPGVPLPGTGGTQGMHTKMYVCTPGAFVRRRQYVLRTFLLAHRAHREKMKVLQRQTTCQG